jgi:hypothetical protein
LELAAVLEQLIKVTQVVAVLKGTTVAVAVALVQLVATLKTLVFQVVQVVMV